MVDTEWRKTKTRFYLSTSRMSAIHLNFETVSLQFVDFRRRVCIVFYALKGRKNSNLYVVLFHGRDWRQTIIFSLSAWVKKKISSHARENSMSRLDLHSNETKKLFQEVSEAPLDIFVSTQVSNSVQFFSQILAGFRFFLNSHNFSTSPLSCPYFEYVSPISYDF